MKEDHRGSNMKVQLVSLLNGKKKYHTVGTIQKYNWKLVQSEKVSIPPNTHIHYR